MKHLVGQALTLVAVLATTVPAQQQTVRWNDVIASLGEEAEAPPGVRVWLDQRILRYGEPVRVGFRVEEDAFVVVARVDWEGHLTVLHPSGKTRLTAVRGGEDVYIRGSRLGRMATFAATERRGGSGYVFALASRSPLDLSQLSLRDFSSWVTGMPVGRPVSRYIGDPYRVIQRFARVVLYNPESEWDYDVDFYSVELPTWMTASSHFCGSAFDAYYGRRRMDGWGNRYGYDEFGDLWYNGFGSPLGCNGLYRFAGCYVHVYGFGHIPYFCRTGRPDQVATGPTPPPLPVDPDSLRVNPWAPDSISRPNVEKGTGNVNGPHIMTVDPARPAPVGWSARDDLSFSIPSRALRGLRERRDEIGRSPMNNPGDGGPMPMPARPTPEVSNQPIEWVRPPRSLEAPSRSDIDRMPTRGGIRRSQTDREAVGGGGREWSPPPRSSSPMFEREPPRTSGFTPRGDRYDGRTGMQASPPPAPIRHSEPIRSPGSSEGSRPSSPPPAPAPAATGGTKSANPPAERKPEARQPT
ncbi:MAG: hypothetical protein ACT4P7_10020 [Gemmatimonadaceae bacterium]